MVLITGACLHCHIRTITAVTLSSAIYCLYGVYKIYMFILQITLPFKIQVYLIRLLLKVCFARFSTSITNFCLCHCLRLLLSSCYLWYMFIASKGPTFIFMYIRIYFYLTHTCVGYICWLWSLLFLGLHNPQFYIYQVLYGSHDVEQTLVTVYAPVIWVNENPYYYWGKDKYLHFTWINSIFHTI